MMNNNIEKDSLHHSDLKNPHLKNNSHELIISNSINFCIFFHYEK